MVGMYAITQRSRMTVLWWLLYILGQADCGPPPKLENGRRQYEETSIGAKATYTCNDGYQLTTSISQRECLLQAKWSNENITCESLSGL